VPSTPPTVQETDEDDPALWDVPGQIRKAITEFIAWVAKTGLKPVLDALGATVMATPDLTSHPQVVAFWTASLVTANALFVLFIILAGFVVASRETLQRQYGLKEMLPRLVLGGVGANLSLLLCGKVLWAANALTAAIAGQGVDGPAAKTALAQMLESAAYGHDLLLSLLVLALIVMALVVVITFILRIVCLVLLIGVAPLALVCHATPQTEGLAYTWWRALGACVGIQLAQAVIFVATLRVFLTSAGPTVLGMPVTANGLLAPLVGLSMMWLLIKLPGWMRQFVLGPLGQRSGRGLLGQVIHAYLTIKTLGAATGLLKGGPRLATARYTAGRASTNGTAARTGTPRPSPAARAPRTPRMAPPRRTPPPAGPAPFSHAPTAQTPLAQPVGANGAPAFSSVPPPASPAPAPTGSVPPAGFSHLATTQTPAPRPSAPAALAVFSSAGSSTPVAATTRPAPAAVFSAAPAPQAAVKRPPAPVTPAFSAPPASAPAARTSGRRIVSAAPSAPSRAPGTTRPTRATTSTPAPIRSAPTPRPTPATTTPRPAPTARVRPSPASRATPPASSVPPPPSSAPHARPSRKE
jgi:hypothetical protein